jgi:hypothetical protein
LRLCNRCWRAMVAESLSWSGAWSRQLTSSQGRFCFLRSTRRGW